MQRLKIDSDGQAFVPYAVNIDGGVDIYVAGRLRVSGSWPR